MDVVVRGSSMQLPVGATALPDFKKIIIFYLIFKFLTL